MNLDTLAEANRLRAEASLARDAVERAKARIREIDKSLGNLAWQRADAKARLLPTQQHVYQIQTRGTRERMNELRIERERLVAEIGYVKNYAGDGPPRSITGTLADVVRLMRDDSAWTTPALALKTRMDVAEAAARCLEAGYAT